MIRYMATSLRALLLLTLLTGVIYPALMLLIGRSLFPEQAQGSLIRREGVVVGSALVAQRFTSPGYFYPRPSASNYGAMPAGASNQSPTAKALLAAVAERQAQGAGGELLFASGSGLDPEIIPADARSQIPRIMAARGAALGLDEAVRRARLEALIHAATLAPDLAFLGPERVNVLHLNLALDRLVEKARP
jgi:K+-transporting ATPase ATPase C chain